MDEEFDWLTLDAEEEVVWAETPHPYSLVPAIVVGVLLAVVLVGVVVIVGAYLSHKNTNYVVTTDALYKKTGVLSRNVQRIEFEKVQDTSYRQSFLGAHFGYGTVDVSTAGGGGVEMSFGNVADPLSVQTLINERLRATRGRTAGEDRDADEVLGEILAELRAIRSAFEGSAPVRPDVHRDSADATGTAAEGVDDPTGRLEAGDVEKGDGADGPTAGTEAGEPTPEPADDGSVPAEGDSPDREAEEFSFEDRR